MDDEDESSLLNEDAVLKTPPELKAHEAPVDTTSNKKVILKRKLNVNISAPSPAGKTSEHITGTSDEALMSPTKIAKTTIIAPSASDSITSSSVVAATSVDSSSDGGANGDKKVVKLSELSAKDRLEMRAKKFGVPIAPESAKLARSQRFGTAADASSAATTTTTATTGVKSANSASTIKANKEPASVDLLKKRAERFGGSVSKAMTKIENTEKLQKRNERFAAAAKSDASPQVVAVAKSTSATETTTAGDAGAVKNDFADKARQRLERFKAVVA